MKITNKKTLIFFLNKEDHKQAIDFLLKVNVKFRAALVNNWIEVAPKNYISEFLDLYLPKHKAISTFNVKF